MRRAKLGDVYAVKVPNGYKIIQWAYFIEKYGTFIRVFDGLYEKSPTNIAEIVAGEHSYVTDLFVGRAYRIGLLDFLGNYPVPAAYPFPESQIAFYEKQGKVFGFRIEQRHASNIYRFDSDTALTTTSVLPEEYHNVKRLAHCVSPDWLLYLFDNDFSLDRVDVFYPWIYLGECWEDRYQIYIDMVENAMEKDRINRKKQNCESSCARQTI